MNHMALGCGSGFGSHQKSQRRPRYRTFVALLLILVLLAACGRKTTQTPSPQVLTWPNVNVTDIATLDPALGPDANELIAERLIYSGLTRLNSALHVEPDAAQSWAVSPDGRVYTFTLRPDLRYSDGTPATASDVAASLTRTLDPRLAPAGQEPAGAQLFAHIEGAQAMLSGKAQQVQGIQALNTRVLRITLDEPVTYLLQALASPIAYIVSPQTIARYGEANWSEHTVGTGPFEISSWQHNVRLEFVPNPYYYGPHPQLRAIVMPFVADPHAALLSYRAGRYDLDWDIAPADYLLAQGDHAFHQVPKLATDVLVPNTTIAPFNQLDVRLAFAEAIDQQALAHDVLNDTVMPARQLLPPALPGYQSQASPPLSYNPVAAKQLLATAYPDATTLPPITLSFAADEFPMQEAQALQAMWQQALGVQVQLNPVEPAAYAQELAQHRLQLAVVRYRAAVPDPWAILARYLRSGAPDNVGQWSDSQFDQLVAQADVLPDSDPARLTLYQQAEAVALQNAAVIPLDYPYFTATIAPYVHGLVVTPLGIMAPDWSKVTVSPH
jgi:oligopeptide transport system substrate-binding protein